MSFLGFGMKCSILVGAVCVLCLFVFRAGGELCVLGIYLACEWLFCPFFHSENRSFMLGVLVVFRTENWYSIPVLSNRKRCLQSKRFLGLDNPLNTLTF